MEGKMHLGGAGAKLESQADVSRPHKGKERMQIVRERPSGMPNKQGMEPNGKGSASPLRMKGMK